MNKLLITIANGLSSVIDFSGRSSRRDFWIYTGFVTAVVFILTFVAILPPYAHRAMHGARAAYSHDIKAIIWATVIVATIWIALLAAATVRRLHDGGRSWHWAALPLPFLGMGFTLTSAIFDAVTRPMPPPTMVFYGLLVSNVLFLCTLLLLGFLLALPARCRDHLDGITPIRRPNNTSMAAGRGA